MANNNGRKSILHIPSIIGLKRDGKELTEDEIKFVIDAISGTPKSMEDAQIGALLMAIRTRGMTNNETIQLTRSMTASGHVFRWPDEWRHLLVDKHSTGGVGDKVSLALAPALAACGMKVPMISGRGLGHTGGTLDKLESIPGFCVEQSQERIRKILDMVGCCIVGQTPDIVPADRILYAIRDVTSTVDSTPLLSASIISKKAAESISALVLDIKFGKGAVFQSKDEAKILGQSLVSVSNGQGIKTTGLLTNMDSPLGNMVGNALEIAETIQVLHGSGHRGLLELIHYLGGHLLVNARCVSTVEEGVERITQTLQDGSALQTFCSMIQAQGVAKHVAEALCDRNTDVFTILPRASNITEVLATQTGYIKQIDALECARVSGALGAARNKAGDLLDFAVGIELIRHVAEHVEIGEVVLVIHHTGPLVDDLRTRLEEAIHVEPALIEYSSLIDSVIS